MKCRTCGKPFTSENPQAGFGSCVNCITPRAKEDGAKPCDRCDGSGVIVDDCCDGKCSEAKPDQPCPKCSEVKP